MKPITPAEATSQFSKDWVIAAVNRLILSEFDQESKSFEFTIQDLMDDLRAYLGWGPHITWDKIACNFEDEFRTVGWIVEIEHFIDALNEPAFFYRFRAPETAK